MIEHESSLIVPCSPQEIYAFLTDLSNVMKWRSDTYEYEVLTPGPFTKGTRWIERTNYLGRKGVYEIEVLNVVPDRQYSSRTTHSSVGFVSTYTLEPVPEGTRITLKVQGELIGLIKMLEPLIRSQITKSIDTNFGNLKRALENSIGNKN